MEAKYYRDYGHNYMILQCGQQEAVRSYQYKILTSGKIGEILKCSVRHVNGSTYYYYDISSRTSLDSLYRGRKMSRAQVKDVLGQIQGIYAKLAGYFMDEAGLVLLPEHIYYDITAKRYIGLYYPDHRPEETNPYGALLSFLAEHIGGEDRDLAERVYRMCEMAEENCFFVEDALRILEEDEEPVMETAREKIVQGEQDLVITWAADHDTAEDCAEPEEYAHKSEKKNLFYPVFALLSVLGIAGAVAVYSMYELTQREELVIYGVLASMGVCLFFCIAGIFATGRKKAVTGKERDKESKEGYFSDFDEELYREPRNSRPGESAGCPQTPSLDQVLNRDMDLEMAGYRPEPGRSAEEGGWNAAERRGQAQPDDYGRTVFFDERAVGECKLYAMDKKNKNHIELREFPCTIGKMAGCVDHVLADSSVSRIHARFDRQGERVLLTDMNSTNGTFKNGLRMRPQETVEIEPGDEVRFGNLNYCYR